MGRILAVDYGGKRCGVAVTDPMRIIVTGLDTIPPGELIDFIKAYHEENEVGLVVFGIPYRADGSLSPIASDIKKKMDELNAALPNVQLDGIDESYTSAEAVNQLIQAGVPKKKRRNKSLTDKMSATLILRRYLDEKNI